MAKITQDMKDLMEKTPTFILATTSQEGKPNGVPVGLVKLISDDEIMVVRVLMNKTWQNIVENPVVALTFWGKEERYGYQCKGKARVETSGKLFNEAVHRIQEHKPPFPIKTKAVVIINVDEIYRVGANVDCGTNLAEQEDEVGLNKD